ncbi:MAG: nucleotidyltransferase, partial [Bacteroidia bacterium]|nr:nucleotidyltransferase [Bacteroidia bacterium]
FYDEAGRLGYEGILKKEYANEVALSSIPQGEKPHAYLYCNLDGYSVYCREYREYWEWVDHRNEARYEGTLAQGKNYDAKHMMHTFRLLDMAREIAERGEIRVRRPNRTFLLDIRQGKYSYEELLDMAQEKIEHLDEVYRKSILPDEPDETAISQLLFEIRDDFYRQWPTDGNRLAG